MRWGKRWSQKLSDAELERVAYVADVGRAGHSVAAWLLLLGLRRSTPHCLPIAVAMPKRSTNRSHSPNRLSMQRAASGNSWVLSHPRAARDCAEDLEEVRSMIAAGEMEVATDELRWLLGTCPEIIEAHFLLGKLAVEADNDLPLGRGHFGTGYQLGLQAWRRAGRPTPVPALHPANHCFFDAGRGLAWCLHELDKSAMAREILQEMLKLDASDPLRISAWLDEMATSGKTVVDVGMLFE